MENHENYSGYKWEVLKKLYERNENERKRYEDIVHLTNNLYESLDWFQKENRRLIVSSARLEEIFEHQSNVEPGSSKSGERNTLEKRHSVLQDELAELHRQKGEYAEQVISLRAALDEKEKEITEKKAEIQELKASLTATEELLNQVQIKLADTESQRQFIKDEYAALQITYASMDEKKQKLEKENQELITRLIQLKAEDADRMNAETELFMRKKQAKLQKELEEAAKEPVAIDTNKIKNTVCLDAIVPRKVQNKFIAHDGEVNAVAWTHSDFKFVTAGGDRKVKVWDFVSGQAVLKGVAHESNSSVHSVDFDAEETLILAASCDFASRIWSISDMKIKHTLTGHSNKVMSAKFLGETGKVVSGSHDRTLKIWDLRRRACVRSIFACSSVNDVVTSDRNATNIVSGHFDKKIRFWDMRSDSSTNEILLQGRITSLDLSLDGYSLLSSVRDDSLKLIDFRMNNVVRTFSSDGFLIGCDWARAKFSPDGQFCVCGSQDGCIYIWVVSTGALKKILREHCSTVIACAWSWCGNYLLSCDKSRNAILWSEF
ncbi:autophagy-related protein 16-1-like [Argiope bruennichi]|uniref:Autophagy-related protein 16-1 like protein n=1 Tax=Argiope bruennichi TaxID=94029 RepID=A0A8T0F2Z3_ARGBR|nr:autophagy-related protein 16-1-like [Argiope bruennichi]KAF8785536.1 Autophagy-related protein 16-1 like protein [Argiope bruennichi]